MTGRSFNEWVLFARRDLTQGEPDALLEGSAPTTTLSAALVGRPLFVDKSGRPHEAVNSFFRSPTMLARADATAWRYAHSIRVWLNFLERTGSAWDLASSEELASFKFWRRTDPENPVRISGSAWKSDLAAYFLLYQWASRQGLSAGPFADDHDGTLAMDLGSSRYSTNQIRSADVKWLTPAAYRRWRDIGILGLDVNGQEKLKWRPRSEERDQAFVAGMYGTGLRLQEWSSVLDCEISKRDVSRRFLTTRLADACGKGGRGRNYWIRNDVLGLIDTYREHDRRRSIARAQAAGAYERISMKLIIESEVRNGRCIASNEQGTVHELDLSTLKPAARRHLFVRRADGIEPAQLWLNEDGVPRAKQAWYKTFAGANARLRKAGLPTLQCKPHMLRHSFALRWYAIGRVAWEGRLSHLSSEERSDFRAQFGDTWNVVQGLLGHRNVETTKNVYLEPFRNLNTSLLLEQFDDDDAAQFQLRVLEGHPRVADDPMRPGGDT